MLSPHEIHRLISKDIKATGPDKMANRVLSVLTFCHTFFVRETVFDICYWAGNSPVSEQLRTLYQYTDKASLKKNSQNYARSKIFGEKLFAEV